MTVKIASIDDMPNLKAKLGKARTDRIRYVGQQDTRKQKYATNLHNTIIGPMQFIKPHDRGCRVTDILTGVSRMDTKGRHPLSVDRLFNILQCVTTINTREVMTMMAVDNRQAQRYVRAIKVALPMLEAHFDIPYENKERHSA